MKPDTTQNVIARNDAISPSETPTLMPKLRFAAFEGEWEEKLYGEIYSFYTTNSFSRNNLNYDAGKVKNIHYGDIHTKFATLFDVNKELVPFINEEIDLSKISDENYCQIGDLVIADASEDYDDIGKTIEITNLNNEAVLAGLHTFLARPNKYEMQVGFSGYLVKTWKVRKQIMTIAQGSKVLGLATGRLSKIKLNLPTLPEQQKIATFLTAVDTKLQQLTTKKATLAQYKKGVMQQLFSQELRFKPDNVTNPTVTARHEAVSSIEADSPIEADSKNAFPDWEEKKLGELIEFSNGKGHEQSIDENGKFVVVNSKFISTSGKIRKYCNTQISPLKKGEIVMVMSDVPKGKALAKCFLIDEDNKYTLNQRICSLKEKSVINKFLIFILNRNRYYLRFDSGVGQTNLKKNEVLNCPLLVPSSLKEQQKIATFLSAIDTKIEAVTTQITKTQQFKKGLLQQMFV